MKRLIKTSSSRRDMLKKAGLVMAGVPLYFGLGSCVNSGKKMKDADVVIIGAGLSGLHACSLLEEAGYKVILVEATDRFGGRVHTVKDDKVPGHPELGANGIGGGYGRVLDSARKLNLKLGPVRPRTEPRKGEILYAINDELILPKHWPTHSYNPMPEGYRKGSPSSPAWSVYSELNPFPKHDMTAWRDPKYASWDKSVYTALKEKGFSDQAIKIAVETNSSYGRDAKNISILMFFQIWNFLMQQSESYSSKGGAIRGGNGRLPEALGNALRSDVELGAPVASIDSSDDGVKVALENGGMVTAKYCIVSIPHSALRRIKINPKPKDAQKLGFDNMSYTPCVQLHFLPKKKYWEEDGLPPSMWTSDLGGRFMALKNDPTDPDKVTSCVAYLNSAVALEVDSMPQEKAIQVVRASLERMRPSLKGALEFVYYWTWVNNPYAGGAYAYWKPGEITAFSNVLANPIKRIHFAGEHTAVLSRGMEGAMESGERAALEIMNLL